LSFNLTACGKEKKEVSFIEFQTASATTSMETENPSNSSDNTNENDTENEVNKLGNIFVGMTDKEVISMMGEADKGEFEVWDTDNKNHQTWSYSSLHLEIDMVGEEGSQTVLVIAAEEDCTLPTNKGISIGSSKQDVINIYESTILDESENQILAGSFENAVVFEFENDKVISIYIGSAA
jgi:hypothetical protein